MQMKINAEDEPKEDGRCRGRQNASALKAPSKPTEKRMHSGHAAN
jgi:hypothetical protein